MKRGWVFPALLPAVFALLLAVQVGAIHTPDSQQDFELVIEQGSQHEFPLVLYDIGEIVDILPSGEIADWIAFGEDKKSNYTMHPPSVISVLPVTVSVPNSTEVGEYAGNIKAGGDTLSDITVKVTPPIADIKVLQEFSRINEEIESLRNQIYETSQEIAGEINLTEEALLGRIANLQQHEKDIARLEGEKADLQANITELEGREFQFTGKMAGNISTAGFAIGFVVGVIAVLLFINRGPVHRRLSKSLSGGTGYRYK